MNPSDYHPVYQLSRGGTVESIHHGAVAIVNSKGQLVASFGNPGTVTYLRSTAKPFQALPFVEQHGPDYFNLTKKELSLLCASHIGTDDHSETAASIQARAGFGEKDLQCGTHPPFDKATRKALETRGTEATSNRHNCSGKHSGMLAFARMNNWPLENYLDADHPVQQHIRYTFAGMCGLPPQEVATGIDGCSAPNFAVPLHNAAWALARLVDPGRLQPERALACNRIVDAMTSYPQMIAGEGEFDTLLMQTAKGRILSKGGAEGYLGMAILPGALGDGSPALGIALKISDGEGRPLARAAFGLEVLRQLGAITPEELASLDKFGPTLPVYNWRKLTVGESRPVFELNWHEPQP